MREIKFRAWDKNRNRFLKNGEMLLGNIVAWKNLKKFSVGYTSDYEIMQYTGLKDKNGKEIWEGDVVERFGEKYLVSFESGSFVVGGMSFQQIDTSDWEIIGDIYTTPDLLVDGKVLK